MAETLLGVSWQAPEHHHIEKKSDWYWIVGIIAVAGSVASMIFNNVLFGMVILLGAMTMIIVSHRKPKMIDVEVSARGIRVEDTLYPYSTLDSFYIDEDNIPDPQLLLKSRKLFVPLIIVPIPEEYMHDIETILASKLHEEHLEEPLSHKLMEFFGF